MTTPFNELLANCLIFHTAVDITKVVNDLIEEGWEVDPVDLATITPYITSKIRRFGTWHLAPGTWHLAPGATLTGRRSGICGWSRDRPYALGARMDDEKDLCWV